MGIPPVHFLGVVLHMTK